MVVATEFHVCLNFACTLSKVVLLLIMIRVTSDCLELTFLSFGLGVRLYFSTSQFKHPAARPSMLTLVHVRLPPGFSASSNVEKPSKVHRALYCKGTVDTCQKSSKFFF